MIDTSKNAETEHLVEQAIAIIRAEGRASANLLTERLSIGDGRARDLMKELERRKIVGPAYGKLPREILNLPAPESPAETSTLVELAAASKSLAPADAQVEPPPPGATAAPAGVVPTPDPFAVSLTEEPKPKEEEPAPDPDCSPSLVALRWFYARLEIVDADVEELWKKRGLNKETVLALGYKSNLKRNRELLLEMANHFPLPLLVECGLWSNSDKPGDPPKPNPQFYGMALVEKRDPNTRKKIRDREGEPIIECVWGDPGPILIPYFDEEGDVIHLRPHKGMMRGKTPRLYIARTSREWRKLHGHPPPVKCAVITEGEFKAAAIWQVMGPEYGAAAMPGITMAKLLFGDVEDWLDLCSIRQVVIGYDSEDKGNLQLPGYQEDKWRRFDAQIWARVLAVKLAKENYEAKIATLPPAWRDERGKADWDGYLAKMLDREFCRLADLRKDLGGMELWKEALPEIRGAFTTVIRNSVLITPQTRQRVMFAEEDERIIERGVEKYLFEPSLPVGGEDEEATARRLQRFVVRLRREGSSINDRSRRFLSNLARAYLGLRGRYYIFKRLGPLQEATWQKYLQQASSGCSRSPHTN